MKLKIRSVEVKGFKPYKEAKVLCFDDNTLIEADNGQGKSSIADAICFAFLGTGADGVEKAGAKLLNNESKDMYVMLVFDIDGEEHVLTRAKKSSKSELILDTNSIEQVELMNWIKQKDLFLSIFTPMYFTAMTPKDQKELLQKHLGEISFDEVIKKMGMEGQTLLDDCFMVPQLYIDRKREELKDAESRENFLKGFLVGKGDIEIPQEKIFSQQEDLNRLKADLEKLNTKPIQLHDISSKVEQHKEMANQLSALNARKYKLEMESSVFPEEEQLNKKKLERERMLMEHKNLKAQIEIVKTVICPNCHTEIEAVPGMREQIEQQIHNTVLKGRSVATEILDIQDALHKKKEERRLSDVKELEVINKQIADIQQRVQGNDISRLQAENDKYINDLQKEKSDIQQQVYVLENAKRDADEGNRNRQRAMEESEKNKQEVEAANYELSTFEPLREKLNQDIDRAKKFNATKLRMQGEFIGQFLDKVNIQFQKIVKSTGEVKDDFKLQYEGKDFNLLSTSERIKAGLEISNLLMNATGYIYPVFVDNAESITVIPQLGTQMIVAKVKEGEVLR